MITPKYKNRKEKKNTQQKDTNSQHLFCRNGSQTRLFGAVHHHIKFTYVLVSLLLKEQDIWADKRKLGTTLTLSQDRIDWPLLEAAISFWDPVAMVFCFGKHELTPPIKKLEYFLNLKHCHHKDTIFPMHKNSYFKDFQSTLNVQKNFLPRETSGDYLHCPFNLLLEQGWQKVGDFLNPAKYRAFTLTILGQLLFSRNRHQINGVLCSILQQLSEGKTLAPMIIIEITSSLSHCAWHCKGQLFGCPAFLQAWLRGHLLIAFIHSSSKSISFDSFRK